MKSQVIHIRLSSEEFAVLREGAARVHMPVSAFARVLMTRQLDAEDPIERFMRALEADPKLRYRLHRILILLPQDPR